MLTFRGDLDLLRDRRFVLLLGTRTISYVSASFAPIALAFGILELPGATAKTLSTVLTAQQVPLVAFLLVGGVLADRLRRNRVIFAGEVMNAVALFSLAAMLFTGWTPLWALSIAAAISGIGTAVLFPAVTGIIPEIVAADRLQPANAILGFGGNSARITGFVAGGATVVFLGGPWALAISGMLAAVAGAMVTGLRTAAKPASAGHSVLVDLRDGWREFWSRQWLWVVVLQFSILVMAVQAAHGVLGPVVAKQELGGAAAWSVILTAEGIGMLVGVFFSIRMRPRRPILIATFASITMSLPYLFLGIAAPLWMVAIGAFILGICFDIFGVLWQTTLQREIPNESLSRVSAYDALGSFMFGPIGLILAGPAAVLIGARPALVWCAAIVAASSVAALCFPGVRNLRAPDPAPKGDKAVAPVGIGHPTDPVDPLLDRPVAERQPLS